MMRQSWICKGDAVALTWQCALAGVSRATIYARQKPKLIAVDDEVLKRLIDEEYTRHPFYGSRKMVVYLRRWGHTVNRKRAQRLMRKLGLQGMAPGPNTSRAHPQHKVYPYLLRGVAVERPNQVWSTDITYISLARGFAYLVAMVCCVAGVCHRHFRLRHRLGFAGLCGARTTQEKSTNRFCDAAFFRRPPHHPPAL